MEKIIRTATVPMSLNILLKGQLKYLSQYFEIIGISSTGEDIEIVAAREEIRVIAIDMERRINPLKDLVSLVKLFKQLKKEKPQVIHSITPKAGLLCMLAGKAAGVPVRIHTFTGLIFPSKTGMVQKLLILMDRLLCWAATNVYPEGQGIKKDLVSYKITSKPLKVIANGNVNGIDTTFFSPNQVSEEQRAALKASLTIASDDFVFIFVGRLVGDKGIHELVEAFSRIYRGEGSHSCKLLLVGPLESALDPLRPETLEEIETNPHIISVGFQSDIRPYLAVSNALAFPSYREGFPNVVMQAGSMGLPAIVTDINGCNEIVVEGQNGLIIPAKNVDSLHEAMTRLMYNSDLYSHLQANARPMITSRYEQQVVWDALLEEYQDLIKTKL